MKPRVLRQGSHSAFKGYWRSLYWEKRLWPWNGSLIVLACIVWVDVGSEEKKNPQPENKPEMPKNVDEQWATLQTPTTVEGFLE